MNKNTVVALLALIPVIIILTSTFSSDIIRVFVHKENAFNLPMKDKILNENLMSYYTLQEYLTGNLFIPNYDSKINIIQDPSVVTGKNIRFKVNIEDAGILPMDKPYYYIYLLDPNKRVRGCFPDCDFTDKNLEGWPTSVFVKNNSYFYRVNISHEKTSFSDKSDATSMSIGEDLPEFGAHWDSLLPYRIKNYDFGLYPMSLAEGKGQILFNQKGKYIQSKQIYTFYYTFPSDEAGDWEVYVLSFNGDYMDRKGQPLYSQQPADQKKKIISYEKAKIVVKDKEKETLLTFFDNHMETTFRLIKVLAAIIGSILTYRTLYYLINKYYKRITGFIDSSDIQKRIYLALIVILLVLLLVQYLIMRN